MTHITFDPAALTGVDKEWWDAWQSKALKATQAIIAKWEETGVISSKQDFQAEIWGELKDWLLEKILDYKCAYCETDLRRNKPECEHYRPKAGVKYRTPDAKRLTKAQGLNASGQPMEHPGYFWLAYHWKNLLPSCSLCNSGGGKNNQFPTGKLHVLLQRVATADIAAYAESPAESIKWPGNYYLGPDDLTTLEDPLLLHPYKDEPSQHIRFGEFGIEAPGVDAAGLVSPKGKHSIDVYDLKNEKLRALRSEAQIAAEAQFRISHAGALLRGLSRPACLQYAWDQTMAWMNQQKPAYHAAILDWVTSIKQNFK